MRKGCSLFACCFVRCPSAYHTIQMLLSFTFKRNECVFQNLWNWKRWNGSSECWPEVETWATSFPQSSKTSSPKTSRSRNSSTYTWPGLVTNSRFFWLLFGEKSLICQNGKTYTLHQGEGVNCSLSLLPVSLPSQILEGLFGWRDALQRPSILPRPLQGHRQLWC